MFALPISKRQLILRSDIAQISSKITILKDFEMKRNWLQIQKKKYFEYLVKSQLSCNTGNIPEYLKLKFVDYNHQEIWFLPEKKSHNLKNSITNMRIRENVSKDKYKNIHYLATQFISMSEKHIIFFLQWTAFFLQWTVFFLEWTIWSFWKNTHNITMFYFCK